MLGLCPGTCFLCCLSPDVCCHPKNSCRTFLDSPWFSMIQPGPKPGAEGCLGPQSFAPRSTCLKKQHMKNRDMNAGNSFWLVVVYPPLWKIWESIGMISNPIYGKIKNVPNHQPVMHLESTNGIKWICCIVEWLRNLHHTSTVYHLDLSKNGVHHLNPFSDQHGPFSNCHFASSHLWNNLSIVI